MSESSATALVSRARASALKAVWAQWGALNSRLLQQAGTPPLNSVIDPEALVLASLVLWDEERRLVDVLAWWAEKGASLMSVRRLASLQSAFPKEVGQRFDSFAKWARDAGDTRWKPITTPAGDKPSVRSGKGPAELDLEGSVTLLLKLRAAFGVGTKPDVLCYLLSLDGRAATSKDIARAVAYTDKNVREAARALVLGGFADERKTHPVEYTSRPGFALSLLRLVSRAHHPAEAMPSWIGWWGVYAFLLRTASLSNDSANATPYLLSSRARDLFAEYHWVLLRPDLRLPDPDRYPGESYVGAFSDTVNAISDWIEAHM